MANERKLIDADEAKKALTGRDTDPTDEEIERTIDELPTIEATPVVHGRWKRRKNWTRSVCSACSFENDEETRYCPNCGAKMDGGVSDG